MIDESRYPDVKFPVISPSQQISFFCGSLGLCPNKFGKVSSMCISLSAINWNTQESIFPKNEVFSD